MMAPGATGVLFTLYIFSILDGLYSPILKFNNQIGKVLFTDHKEYTCGKAILPTYTRSRPAAGLVATLVTAKPEDENNRRAG
jgi:hypothetical protein